MRPHMPMHTKQLRKLSVHAVAEPMRCPLHTCMSCHSLSAQASSSSSSSSAPAAAAGLRRRLACWGGGLPGCCSHVCAAAAAAMAPPQALQDGCKGGQHKERAQQMSQLHDRWSAATVAGQATAQQASGAGTLKLCKAQRWLGSWAAGLPAASLWYSLLLPSTTASTQAPTNTTRPGASSCRHTHDPGPVQAPHTAPTSDLRVHLHTHPCQEPPSSYDISYASLSSQSSSSPACACNPPTPAAAAARAAADGLAAAALSLSALLDGLLLASDRLSDAAASCSACCCRWTICLIVRPAAFGWSRGTSAACRVWVQHGTSTRQFFVS